MLHRLAERKYRLVAGGHSTTNRIHVRDLATIIEKAISHGEPGATYLASDAMPTAQRELVDRLCQEFGVPRPTELSAEEAAVRMPIDVLKMVMGSKKINSEWTRSSLDIRLKFPDFMTGCRDIWNRERVALEDLWSQGKA